MFHAGGNAGPDGSPECLWTCEHISITPLKGPSPFACRAPRAEMFTLRALGAEAGGELPVSLLVRLCTHSPLKLHQLHQQQQRTKQKLSTPTHTSFCLLSSLCSPVGVFLPSLSQHRDTFGFCLFYFNVVDIFIHGCSPRGCYF